MNEDSEDVNAIVRRLNALAAKGQEGGDEPSAGLGTPETGAPLPAGARVAVSERPEWMLPHADDEARERLAAILAGARGAGATDLFLVAGAPPTLRVDGALRPLGPTPLDSGELGRLCAALVPDPRRSELAAQGSADLACDSGRVGRMRVNVHRESGRWAAAIRLLPAAIPTLKDLNLPADLAALADLRHGLVLVTGPAGTGKSTTLATLLTLITARRRAHVVTIEDPIEYRHPPGQSLVEQVEIGRDTPAYAAALRAALRQDPDVLLVGEMRDPEAIALVITAAETGHLVFSTLHTGDAAQSITRIIDSCPPAQSAFIRAQLAAALAGVVSQLLLPRRGGGRVPAVEVLLVNDAVRNLIRLGQVEQIATQVTLGRDKGMRSLDQSLAELVRGGLVERDEARVHARRPREFELHLQG